MTQDSRATYQEDFAPDAGDHFGGNLPSACSSRSVCDATTHYAQTLLQIVEMKGPRNSRHRSPTCVHRRIVEIFFEVSKLTETQILVLFRESTCANKNSTTPDSVKVM